MTRLENRRGWHVAKEVPLAMIVAFIIQTFLLVWGASWWARGISAAQDQAALAQSSMQVQLTEMKGQVAILSARYEANSVPMAQALYRLDRLEREVGSIRR